MWLHKKVYRCYAYGGVILFFLNVNCKKSQYIAPRIWSQYCGFVAHRLFCSPSTAMDPFIGVVSLYLSPSATCVYVSIRQCSIFLSMLYEVSQR